MKITLPILNSRLTFATRRYVLAAVMCFGAMTSSSVAHAAKGGKTPTPPPSTGNSGGGITVGGVGGGGIQRGHTPQSLSPVGTPSGPLPPQSTWEKFKDEMLVALAAIDTQAGESEPSVAAVNAAVHRRDVRVASEKLPQRVILANADDKK